MPDPKVLVSESRSRGRSSTPVPEAAWTVVAWLGGGLALVSGIDVILGWIPASFGNREWEFGTVTAMLNNLPALVLGLGLVTGAGLARGRRLLARGGAALLLLVGTFVLLAALLYATDIPIALRSVADPLVKRGLEKAVVKTVAQGVIYPVLLYVVAIKAWRRSAGRTGQQ